MCPFSIESVGEGGHMPNFGPTERATVNHRTNDLKNEEGR